MRLVLLLFALAMPPQAKKSLSEASVDARAERGVGGVQADGWQHIALELSNRGDAVRTGRATLIELTGQEGARPRLALPFRLTDRQVVHFYFFRPPQAGDAASFLITLEDESEASLPFAGAEQLVTVGGRSRRAVRVAMGESPTGGMRVALWGAGASMRKLVSEWNPRADNLRRLQQLDARGRLRGGLAITPEAVALERPRVLPDVPVGYASFHLAMLLGTDLDAELTESQRRALGDWVRGGGSMLFVPRKIDQLGSPFWRDLTGLQAVSLATAEDDRDLARWITGPVGRHQPVYFLTSLEGSRAAETTVSYQGNPVVFSVAAGYGRVWIVAFDPESHGGVARYAPLWNELLDQALQHRLEDRNPPLGLTPEEWSLEADRSWLRTVGERFGNYPALETLAVLILCYLLVVGPLNYVILKRREARVWFLVTVPVLASAFGVAVLLLGYYSHGLRSALNQVAIAVVTPEGDRAFAEEYLGVYATRSDVYRVGLPRGLPGRPLGEFATTASGGYSYPSNFLLTAREGRAWLEDWRIDFWQTRGIAALDTVPLRGHVTALRSGDDIDLVNQTPIAFETVRLLSSTGVLEEMGSLKPLEKKRLPAPQLALESRQANASHLVGAANSPRPDKPDGKDEAMGPEASALLSAAQHRFAATRREWVLGLTRDPVHRIDSPDTRRQFCATLYVWPVQGAEPADP